MHVLRIFSDDEMYHIACFTEKKACDLLLLCRGDLQKDFQTERNLARDRQQKIAELNAVSFTFLFCFFVRKKHISLCCRYV